MNILIVSAHPEPASLTNALRDAAAEQLRADGHDVHVGDLYAAGWKASVDRQDFPALLPGERLRVAAASSQATASGTLTADVAEAQAEMLWADALILAFPLWWMSMPAILKGWVDRVYSYGFAYRRQNAGDYAIPSLELRADAAAPGVTGFAAHLRPAPEGAERS